MPQGFFSKKETESISAVDGQIHSCASCGLYRDCMSPKMKPYGDFEKGIMVIGEGPGRIEDERGKPWQGKAGQLLQRAFRKQGIDLFKDCLSLNAVNCRPPGNRAPSNQEIDHCRSVIVWKALQKHMPKVIITFGSSALQSIIGHRWNGGAAVSRFRGYAIPDQELKSWLCPTLHPSYLMRMGKPKDMMRIWMEDIQQALEKSEEKFPRHSTPEVRVKKDLSFLEDWGEKLSAFDYETTGIKPHASGHRIVSGAITDSGDYAYAFEMPKKSGRRLPLRKWLNDKGIPKIAHNIKYEDQWSREILKVPVRNWEWDTMLAAHLLDNRRNTVGLKFQTYVHFGIMGYEQEVSRYLKSGDEHGNNTKNRIQKLMKSKSGVRKVLKYNALDAAFEYKLAMKQMKELDWDFLPF